MGTVVKVVAVTVAVLAVLGGIAGAGYLVATGLSARPSPGALETRVAVRAFVVALVFPSVMLAHEGHPHRVMGTVSAVTVTQLDIKTADGKIVMVALDAKTVYQSGKTKVDAKMLKVGERVVVSALQAEGARTMTAQTGTAAGSGDHGLAAERPRRCPAGAELQRGRQVARFDSLCLKQEDDGSGSSQA